jgi:hypothetical protein
MMFRKRRARPEIVINGTSLPKKYWNADVYGTIAVAKDGKSYAQVNEQGTLITGVTSTPGSITIDDKVLLYDLPRKNEQVINADVFLENGKYFIGSRPDHERGRNYHS